MADQAEIVIVGEDGTEHVFPSGFDPKKAAAIVRGQAAPQTQQKPFDSRELVPAMGRPFVDIAAGAVKGALSTASNLGGIARRIPGVSKLDALMTPAQVNVTPSNAMESVGKAGEQIAEVAYPSRAITRIGTKAAEVAGPTLARLVGDTAGRVIPRAMVEATGAAGLASAQGGDPRVAAALGAAAPVVGAAMGGKFATGLKQDAEKKVMQALGPTKERFKAMAQRLTPEILRRGLGGSREGLLEKASGMVEEVGGQIDDAIQKFGSREVGTQPVMQSLERAKDAFRTVAKDGKVVEFEPRAIRQLDGLQKVIADLGPDARVDQLIAVRRAWDKVVDQAGGFSHRAGGAIGVPLKDQSEAWAKREASGAIRTLLAGEVPELAAVNKEFAFWKSLSDVLGQTLKRTEPQGPSLGGIVKEAGIAAATSSHGLGAALGMAKVGKLANQVFTSPRWRFVDARLRNALADALTSGSNGQAIGVLARIAAVQSSQLPAAAGAR